MTVRINCEVKSVELRQGPLVEKMDKKETLDSTKMTRMKIKLGKD